MEKNLYILEKKLKDFSAAHRLINGYRGKCQMLHGHNYSLSVNVAAAQLDPHGFVMEFSAAKKLFDQWVQENLDHATITISDDAELIAFLTEQQQKHYILPGATNSTVELIAKHIFDEFNKILANNKNMTHQDVFIQSVSVWETKSFGATYGLNTISTHGNKGCG